MTLKGVIHQVRPFQGRNYNGLFDPWALPTAIYFVPYGDEDVAISAVQYPAESIQQSKAANFRS